jgi:hypothetical protein
VNGQVRDAFHTGTPHVQCLHVPEPCPEPDEHESNVHQRIQVGGPRSKTSGRRQPERPSCSWISCIVSLTAKSSLSIPGSSTTPTAADARRCLGLGDGRRSPRRRRDGSLRCAWLRLPYAHSASALAWVTATVRAADQTVRLIISHYELLTSNGKQLFN